MLSTAARYESITTRVGNIAPKTNYLAIQPGPGVNGVWVDPVPNLVIGDLKAYAETASVESIRIPGYWTQKLASSIGVTAPPQAGEKLVYFLHGGGYIQCSAHPGDITAAIPRGLLKSIESVHRVFAIEYRLSSGELSTAVNPFPAALLDALAGYNYLVNVIGFSPSEIIICGDSAGGNLALALTRYLVENQSSSEVKLPPPPAGLLLLAPWSDLSNSNDQLGSSMFRNEQSDFVVTGEGYEYMKKAYLGPHGLEASETNRYVSPACKYPSFEINFAGFPRTFIIAGGAEMFLDQIKTLHQRMVKDLGSGDGVGEGEGKVRYLEAPDAVHVFLLLEWHEPERSSALKEIADWMAVQS
jgi:acetyl esterase/lipase